MTRYAYDIALHHLVAVIPRGAGSTAHTVARLHERTDEQLGLRLAHQLTLLSTEVWLHYTDSERAGPVPAQAALAGLRAPNRPRDGRMRVEPAWVVERGHEVGRTLVEIGSAGVRRAVMVDVADELDSVDRALVGDLQGRAGQAVELTRLDALPEQVAAADSLLHDAPSGCGALLTDIEPTAACVAAAHWVTAAVDVTLGAIGSDDTRDVFHADETANPFDALAPRALATWIGDGEPPQLAVQRLIRPAMEAARGFVPDPGDCLVPGMITLDPGRPARHLLDRLLLALRTCRRVYDAHRSVHDGNGDFERAVRSEATRTAGRLLVSVQ